VGRKPTRKSRRGRRRWRSGYEEDHAFGLWARGWTQREIFEALNEERRLFGQPPLEDVIGTTPYYRAVRDRVDAGRARAEAASARYKKLLKQDVAVARQLGLARPPRRRGPAATRRRRPH